MLRLVTIAATRYISFGGSALSQNHYPAFDAQGFASLSSLIQAGFLDVSILLAEGVFLLNCY